MEECLIWASETAARLFLFTGGMAMFLQTVYDVRSAKNPDPEKRMKISPAKNFFMMGVVLATAIITGFNTLYIIAFFVFTLLFTRGFGKSLGGGDRETLYWVLPGFALLGWIFSAVFLLAFCGVFLLDIGIKRKLKVTSKRPGMPIMLAAFVLTAIIYLL